MKVGNKTHAIGLSVIGIIAVLALIIQMKAKMATQSVLRAPAKASPNTLATNVPPSLPHMVYGDPFTHPKLPRLVTASKATDSSPESSRGGVEPRMPGLTGNLGLLPVNPPGPAGEVHATSPEKGPLLYLQAIVTASKAVALISIDGKDAREVSAGEAVAANVSVLAISDGEITLHIGMETKTLKVGAKLQL